MNEARTIRPYGLWDSPLTPASLAEGRRLDGVAWDTDGCTLVWLEGRSGRGVLVCQTGDDAPRDLTTDQSVRAEVGYGGGDFAVHGGWVYFVVHKTGRIFRQPLAGGSSRAITPAFGQAAGPSISPDGRWVAYVHHDQDDNDRLAVVDAEGRGWPQILAGGHDFYMQPRWSPDGTHFCFVAWNHPAMPWDTSELYLATVEQAPGGSPQLAALRRVAGGPEISVFQGEFTPDGRYVIYISDETGWGRLAVYELASGKHRWLSPEGVEYATPAWLQGMRTYAVTPQGQIVAASAESGFQRLERIDPASGQTVRLAALANYSEIAFVAASPAGERVAVIASAPALSPRVVVHDLDGGQTRVAARATGETVPVEALARCEAIQWRSGVEAAHGLFYAPASLQFESPGLPPLVVLVHGGPTSQVKAGWRAEAQFFATRGYAVLLVNYRGSTGYGRDYMLKLRGNWGVCDVEDSIEGMRHLAESGRIDAERTVIMGGSAGGFTVLQTMVREAEAFAAGISLYGVADQFNLAAKTHKFERRYLDSLLGPLPQAAALYRERSPVFHAGAIRRPLAVFQGSIDTVVPKEQSDAIVEALRRNGTPHVYHVYEGEGHGWRKRETIEHFYAAVDEFLQRHVVFA